MIEITEYLTEAGDSPFAAWFDDLKPQMAAKVTSALAKAERGNLGDLKSIGGGVQEIRIHAGPGLRIYLGRDGDRLVILLGGSTKKRQQAAIAAARDRWTDYKRRKT